MYGGNVIGVLLKPQSLEEKEFKVQNSSCRSLSDNKKLSFNFDAMIEDFYTIGKGLVKSINIQLKEHTINQLS